MKAQTMPTELIQDQRDAVRRLQAALADIHSLRVKIPAMAGWQEALALATDEAAMAASYLQGYLRVELDLDIYLNEPQEANSDDQPFTL